jgi:hypothetical protein
MKWPWKQCNPAVEIDSTLPKNPRVTNDDLDNAVLRVLGLFTFLSSDTAVEFGYINQERIDTERRILKGYRDWMLATDLPPRVRRAYNKWLNYFEGRCNEAQLAIDTGARERHDRQRAQKGKRDAQKDEIVSSLLEDFPRPPMTGRRR